MIRFIGPVRDILAGSRGTNALDAAPTRARPGFFFDRREGGKGGTSSNYNRTITERRSLTLSPLAIVTDLNPFKMATDGKEHLSIVICGHVDSGKSTTTGRLIFELGGIPEREVEKLKAEADALGKSSFAFAFYMDRQKEERERGVTISCTTKEFFTDNWHYTIIDAPGHRDFIKNMISGAAQADVALLMVPADGNFTTAIQKGNHKAGEVQGQTRQHARLINLLGVKQLIVGINKMDCDTAGYKESRYEEIRNEMKNMLIKVGWKKDYVEKCVPVLPISGWMGDNLIKKTDQHGLVEGHGLRATTRARAPSTTSTASSTSSTAWSTSPSVLPDAGDAPPHLRRVQDQGCR